MRRAAGALLVAGLLLIGGCATKRSAPNCRPPRLVPGYLPNGLHRTNATSLVPSGWSATWKDETRTVQVAGDVDANLGDGPEIKTATVRGQRAGYGPTGNPAGPLAVEWTEASECRGVQYAVIVKGLPTTEMLKIANGLRPGYLPPRR